MNRRGPTIRLAKWDANFTGASVPAKVIPRKLEIYGRMQNAIAKATNLESNGPDLQVAPASLFFFSVSLFLCGFFIYSFPSLLATIYSLLE